MPKVYSKQCNPDGTSKDNRMCKNNFRVEQDEFNNNKLVESIYTVSGENYDDFSSFSTNMQHEKEY